MLIADLLSEDEKVKSLTGMVYPVIAPEKAVCPYIVFRRAKVMTRPEKTPAHADTALIEVLCCGSSYSQSVELAEAAAKCLDGIQATSDDGSIRMRSCFLSNATEGWEAQTFIQSLTFTVRIN